VAHASDARLLVLHTVRIKGFSAEDSVAAATGLESQEVEAVLARLAADSLAVHRQGRISGWALTPDGQAEHRRLVAAELSEAGVEREVEAVYGEFLGLNPGLLAAATAWQMREADGQAVLNDHSDPAYDAAILAELRRVHTDVVPLTGRLGRLLDRFSPYQQRLAAAVERVEGGELDWFTKPLVDSYHTVWFELHEDLLLTLGRQRSAEQEVTS